MNRRIAASPPVLAVGDAAGITAHPDVRLDATAVAFAVGEWRCDSAGRATDLRLVAVNATFEALTGLHPDAAIGRSLRELRARGQLAPGFDEACLAAAEAAERTGLPQRVPPARPPASTLDQDPAGRGWWPATALPWGPGRVGLLLDAPGASPQADADLRGHALRQSFLVQLADAVRPLTDAQALQREAARRLGLHLRAQRVVWWDLDGDHAVLQAAWSRGVPPPPDRLALSSFAPGLLAAYRAGELVDVADTAADPRIEDGMRAAYMAASIGALAGLMLMRQDRWVAVLEVHHASPRAWPRAELDLVREVAERLWTAAQRARAEAALRENEARQQFLLQVSDALAAARHPRQVQALAARLLCERLRAHRVAIVVVEADHVVVAADHVMGVASLVGRRPRQQPGVAGLGLGAADVEVVDDVDAARGLSPAQRAELLHAGVAAYIAVPMVHGAAGGALVVHAARRRAWTTAEIALAREVAERAAPAVERARAERSLAEAQAYLREFAARQEAERDAERQRLALDVHDELGQQLTALKLHLGWLHQRLSAGNGLERAALVDAVAGMQNLLDTTMEVTRDLAARLRPPGGGAGLATAALGLAEEFALRTELPCEVRCAVEPRAWAAHGPATPSADTEVERIDAAVAGAPVGALLRILQESLTNVARHAAARRVVVDLRLDDDGLTLEVSDDGRGFEPDRVPPGRLGLVGMRERAARIGATIDWRRRTPCGTIVRVRWPWTALEAP